VLPIIDPFHPTPAPSAGDLAIRVRAWVATLDRFEIAQAGVGLDEDPALARAALAYAPERFFARTEADPRRGMAELARLETLAREVPLRAVTLSPARDFCPIDHPYAFPLYAKCIELDLAVCPRVGVPPERVPFSPQKLERIDPVLCFFPELRMVMRGDCAAFEPLAIVLLRRHANLRLAAATLPGALAEHANETGLHQVIFASDDVGPEHAVKGIPDLPLARPVWPRFLRDNAARTFRS